MESPVVQDSVESLELPESKEPKDLQETQWFPESALEDLKDPQALQEVCFVIELVYNSMLNPLQAEDHQEYQDVPATLQAPQEHKDPSDPQEDSDL